MAGMAYYSQMPVRGGLMLEELVKKGSLNLKTIVAYHPYSQQPEGDDPKTRDFVLRAQQITPGCARSRRRGSGPPNGAGPATPGPRRSRTSSVATARRIIYYAGWH